MAKSVRVRFAPSPTGPLHIGGLRTALFNYLFAKKHGGDFLLRIEDTDQVRYVEGAEAYIMEALQWCGITYDEGVGKEGGPHAPYRQSERKAIYAEYAQMLLDKGEAYYAFDTAQELDAERKAYEERGETFIYNWHNREKLNNAFSLSPEEVKKRIEEGVPYVVRFKMPQETLTLHDLIRGEVVVDTKLLDDKVLFKSDGMPTYHLANIVDDHLMEITHVIRGEEWLPSMALHVLMYRAFGWQAPQFAHLPLILKPAGMGNGKLSKRDGDKMGFPVFPLEWVDPVTKNISKGYREGGYLPEALVNFLALLGWNPGVEQELFSVEELISLFDLEKVNKAGAHFDIEKIKWFNHQYLQKIPVATLVEDFSPIVAEKGVKVSKDKLTEIVSLIRERATFLTDLWDFAHFFFEAPTQYDAKALKKQWKDNSAEITTQLVTVIEGLTDLTPHHIETQIKDFITQNNLGLGQVMPLIRLSLVGEMKGPDVFSIIAILGREETIRRLQYLVQYAKEQ